MNGGPGPRIQLEGVTKRFGGVIAVAGATAALEPGEIHAIIGENGAGKSTLLSLCAGAHAPSDGSVKVAGSLLAPATPAEAIRRGVGMVHQHFMLVGAFTAIENLVLGAEPVHGPGLLAWSVAEKRAQALMSEAALSVRLDARTDELTVGERQRLEILRVLFRGARAVLLDEPTAVLSPLEADDLYAVLRRLADGGATIAVVTHRLGEVTRFADRVTVMRRGRVVLSRAGGASEEELTRAVMGDEPLTVPERPEATGDANEVLVVHALSLVDAAGRRALDRASFTVRAGEIVGVAGVEGNGQRELVRAIAGLEPDATGLISIGGRDFAGLPPAARRERLAVVHEDRHEDGLLLDVTVADNLVLGELSDPATERAVVARRIERFGIQPSDPSRLAGELSGGNQQKIVVARALDRIAAASGADRAAILAQPTRGVDVGAAIAIHTAIGDAARAGLAVLVISADLAELRRLCHRLIVMHRGRVVAERPATASDEELGRLMLGAEAA